MPAPLLLVVEDDRALRQLVVDVLQGEGFGVIAAGDGLEALDLMHDEVELVVLDLQMPRMDGVAFHGELRARGFETPVVLLSGSSRAEATARELSVAGCIRKPFDIDDLVHRVRRLLPEPR